MSEFKFNQSVGKIQNVGERVSVDGGKKKAGSVVHIPAYKLGGIQFGTNKVSRFQQIYKITGHGDVPVFLRTGRDVFMYRGLMALSMVGIAMTLYGMGSMATGGMQKKN